MNRSNPPIHPIFKQLCNGAILVTANNHLAREYRQQFNQLQIRQARNAWESADILPFEAWILSLWQQIRARNPGSKTSALNSGEHSDDRVVLNKLQSKILWEKIISDDLDRHGGDTQPLWNIAATVNAAMSAWQILQDWDISIEDCEKSFLPDHRCFTRWARQFQKRCSDNNWIDFHQLVGAIIHTVSDREGLGIAPLIWAGFDGFTARQQRLIDSLLNTRVDLTIHRTADNGENRKSEYREYNSEFAQWLAAAHWVKDKMDHNPDQRIAIVSPALEKSRNIIDYALSQTLSPHHITNPGTTRDKPFHISLGKKLADLPVVEAAMLLLSIAVNKELQYSTLSKTILNPFIAGADSESSARNKLEFWCRRRLPYRLRLSIFLETLEKSKSQPPTPVIVQLFSSCLNMMDSINSTRALSDWPELLLTWLDQFGWPGECALSSEEFQTVEAFKQEVSALRSLDLVVGPCPVTTVVSILNQRLSEKPFEPESPEVTVEVLGVLESAGLEFDAIWFGGLIERDWPPPLQENSFIPLWLQHNASYRRASISLNVEYAKAQQTRLANQSEELVFSRYCFEDDVELLPSSLFSLNPEPSYTGASLTDSIHFQRPSLENFADTRGLELTGDVARGGTFVIQDQAACPFRAYARHRLGARDESPREPGLDARDRGSLIHGILQGVWDSLRSSKNLNSKSAGELKQIVAENITQHSKRHFHSSGSPRAFFRAQSESLEKLLLDWLDVEKSRTQEFTVVELEKQLHVTLGKLTLSFKIDRIDELGDNTLALIDYKTGDVGSISEWVGERPKSPQLPLYAVAQHSNPDLRSGSPLSTIVFGQVRFGQSSFFGVCRDQPFQMARHPSNRVSALADTRLDEGLKNWPALIEHWHDRLMRLADAHYAGQAEVDPLDKTTCSYCDLHGFCRIHGADEYND